MLRWVSWRWQIKKISILCVLWSCMQSHDRKIDVTRRRSSIDSQSHWLNEWRARGLRDIWVWQKLLYIKIQVEADVSVSISRSFKLAILSSVDQCRFYQKFTLSRTSKKRTESLIASSEPKTKNARAENFDFFAKNWLDWDHYWHWKNSVEIIVSASVSIQSTSVSRLKYRPTEMSKKSTTSQRQHWRKLPFVKTVD